MGTTTKAKATKPAKPATAPAKKRRSQAGLDRDEIKKLVVTVEQAAAMLGIGRTKMYHYVLTEQIPSLKIGRARRVPIEALQNYIRAQLSA